MRHIFNILKIYKRDLKSIIKNPIALLIITGICILPSLYAWINIKACWNPYEHTSTIPVAVVNNDKGTPFRGKNLNMGNQIVESLKKNHKIGWVFVNSADANMGIVDGSYTAMIEIPSNFSSRFTSILDSSPKKPEIIYKVNTKENPVAGKITGVAKDTLSNEITTEFIATVNKTIFSSLNKVGGEAEKNKSNILKLKNNIVNVNTNMDFILSALSSINNNSSNLSSFLTQIKSTIPSVQNSLGIISNTNTQNKNMLKQTQSTLNSSLDNVALNLNGAEASTYRVKTLADSLNTKFTSYNSSEIYSNISKANSELENLNNSISSIIDFLQKMNETASNKSLSDMLVQLKDTQTSIATEKSNLDSLQKKLLNSNDLDSSLVSSITNLANNINTQMINSNKQYSTSVRSPLNSIANNLISSTDDASSMLGTAHDLNNQINNLLKTSIDGSNLSSKVSLDLKNRLVQFKDIISLLSDKLQETNNDDLVQIISILQSNPNFMGNFISTPFSIKDESIYSIPNYGSGMAPVYTVLAIWVGCLLLVSLLKTKVPHFEGYEELTLREKHFGKMLTFMTLSLIQAFIVSVGDLVLLNVYTVNAALLIAFSLVSGLTFCIIVFTLVSVLGNIGKAVSIVFLIVQIAGSGSTYPIQVDPLIFRIMQPLFPFTYSVGGFREAIAGPLISRVMLDFIALILISIFFLLFGFFFKRPLNRIVSKFESGFKKSGIGE
ncbi:YhgE/Pip domain-containing protein [Clostridium felsineum]|uniref:YhgE/Pip domain-containing protein n=1 Tax=Clostridium felsineum TaxID=36839 RepID=UPI00214D2BAC|nr:YhgE/Pip domain-containing protein [Clostridium felsineum]MCR3760332.1 YhgE/Pip domain-containing protein [Clostridium felsineum]